ncbi:MAG: hypothetical protein H6624_00495 [Bdellovibrionaceae bacterium]|nr:hypothetical protein [Bdellovibrionales bacterium]MCB9082786.1 hypothetical protein [Pseudobdellovibrionaceae bacterium]
MPNIMPPGYSGKNQGGKSQARLSKSDKRRIDAAVLIFIIVVFVLVVRFLYPTKIDEMLYEGYVDSFWFWVPVGILFLCSIAICPWTRIPCDPSRFYDGPILWTSEKEKPETKDR